MLLLAFFSLISPATAFADDYESALARAVLARDRALDTASDQDWLEALRLFREAAFLQSSKEVEFELAEAAVHLRFHDEAYAAYEESLALGIDGPAKERAVKFMEEHGDQMCRLEISGTADTRVEIDGRPRGKLPLALPLVVQRNSEGVVHVLLEKDGFRPHEADVAVEPGKVASINVELAPLAAPPAAKPDEPRARAAVPSKPPARQAPSGARSTWGMPVFVAGTALTVGGVATAIILTVFRAEEQESLMRNCVTVQGDDCRSTTTARRRSAQAAADKIASLETARWVAIGGTAIGIAAATAGLAELLSGGSSKRSSHQASIGLTDRELVLAWQGEFQ